MHSMFVCDSFTHADEVGYQLISDAIKSGDRVIVVGYLLPPQYTEGLLLSFKESSLNNDESLLHLLRGDQDLNINLKDANDDNELLMGNFATQYKKYLTEALSSTTNKRRTRIFFVNTLQLVAEHKEFHSVVYAMSRALKIRMIAISSYSGYSLINTEKFRSILANTYAVALFPTSKFEMEPFFIQKLGSRINAPFKCWLLSHSDSQVILSMNGKTKLLLQSSLYSLFKFKK